MVYVTGDTHGEEARFIVYWDAPMERVLTNEDKLIVCGDFGYLNEDSYYKRKILKYMAEKPYQILFIDGNHDNFDVINEYPVEEWCGGKVHIINRDSEGKPKIIHLMRGQIFCIEGKKIFTFGGAYSIDKDMRTPHRNWWPQELPATDEMNEAEANLEKVNNKVDYIITHAAPESIMRMFCTVQPEEAELCAFLEKLKNTITYQHWYMGHLHREKDIDYSHTILWFDVRNIENNELVE